MNRAVRDLWRMAADPADPWGDVMAHWFAIADTLARLGEWTPSVWQYRPGLGVRNGDDVEDWPDTEYAEMVAAGMTADELRHAGNVLARYGQYLERKGLSY